MFKIKNSQCHKTLSSFLLITIFGLLSLSLQLSHAAVFGEIQRFQVSDSSQYPYNTVGQVENFCTGTLVAPNKVLTAAHCIYDFENSRFMPLNFFYLGRNGISKLGTALKIKSFVAHPLYLQTGNEHYDVGILTLESNVYIPTIPIRFNTANWSLDKDDLSFKSIGSIIGYPGDKLIGSMWFVVCEFKRQISNFYRPYYTCDTFGGMSGSAIIMSDQEGSYITGVHTNGGSFNSGLFIIDDIQTFVMQELLSN